MPALSSLVVDYVVALLGSDTGINTVVDAMALADGMDGPGGVRVVLPRNAPADIAERSLQAQYPTVLVYCDKVSNLLTEKFRSFSGKVHITVEVRQSQDRLEEIDRNSQLYCDAVCQLLDSARGNWGHGAFYTGGYEASFGAVKQGGRNFIQSTKIGFEVQVSK